MTLEEIDQQDIVRDYLSEAEDAVNVLVALGKEKKANAETVVFVDDDGNDAIAKVYDYRYYTWKSGDTFDALAYRLLGNADLGSLIAFYNKIAYEDSIEAGTKIKIPVLTESSGSTDNRIYAEPEKQDAYGKDILIDDTGDFSVSDDGDIATCGGKENLTQSIALRLASASTKRIRGSAYGIRSTIGESAAVESYLMSSIEQTLLAEPRISSVDEISMTGEKDCLHIKISYTDINGETGEYTGSI